MATLSSFNATTAHGEFTPISSALNGLPNGAGTIAALCHKYNGVANVDICGLMNTGRSNWYHALTFFASRLGDDDGVSSTLETPTWAPTTDWFIIGVTWPAGGAALERYHHSNWTTGSAWTHSDSSANNGGNRAGPGTSLGAWTIGYFLDANAEFDIALCAAWAGVALTDGQFEALDDNGKTSDWWNSAAGHPTLLIECNTTTPVDIGANPSTFSTIGALELVGSNPSPTWTFDGTGAEANTPAINEVGKAHAGRFGPF